MTRTLATATALLVLVIGLRAAPQDATPKGTATKATAAPAAIASVGQIMEAITIPTSNSVFKAGSEPPTTPEEWKAVAGQALVLAESGNLLMMPGRAVDSGEWMTMSAAQREAAVAVMKAAAAADADALSTAADTLYETCAACHKLYMK